MDIEEVKHKLDGMAFYRIMLDDLPGKRQQLLTMLCRNLDGCSTPPCSDEYNLAVKEFKDMEKTYRQEIAARMQIIKSPCLTEKEQEVLSLRYDRCMPWCEIMEKMYYSHENLMRIAKKAYLKLGKAL